MWKGCHFIHNGNGERFLICWGLWLLGCSVSKAKAKRFSSLGKYLFRSFSAIDLEKIFKNSRVALRTYNVWGAGMAEWWERSLLTIVTRVRFPDPVSYVGWVCCWFPSLLPGFFSFGSSAVPSSTKTNTSKFQFDQEYTAPQAYSTTVSKDRQFFFYLITYARLARSCANNCAKRVLKVQTFQGCCLFISG